jgi:hypothetical protein
MAINYEMNLGLPLEEFEKQNLLIDQELQLELPESISTLETALWDALLRIIRKLYDLKYIDKEKSEYIYTKFYEQDIKQKEKSLRGLQDMMDNKSLELSYVDESMEQWEFEEFVNDTVVLLPDEYKEVFMKTVGEAIGVPYEIESYIASTIETDEISQQRLDKYLNRGNKMEYLDLRKPQPVPTIGRTLSPADLAKKFNVKPQKIDE